MYYEINIALNGTHFFATAKRSISTKQKLEQVAKVLIAAFPESEGYSISATRQEELGKGIDLNELIN